MVHIGHWVDMDGMSDTNLEGQPQLGASLVGACSCTTSYIPSTQFVDLFCTLKSQSNVNVP
jgi:hypothetical protein